MEKRTSEDYMDASDEELEQISAALLASLAELPPTPLEALAQSLNIRDVTTEELQVLFGVTAARITQLWQNYIIPEPVKLNGRNYYPLLQSVYGYIEYLREG